MLPLLSMLLLFVGLCEGRIPPSVTVIPKAATVAVHGSVTFTCKAKGDPSPMLTWYTNGVKISKGAPGYIISGESLTLLVVQWSDQGSILCEATNTLGSKSDGASLTVVSDYAPVWKDKPYNVTLYEGQDYAIPCKAVGSPDPVYTWTKGGVDVNGQAGIVVLDSGKLKFSGARNDLHTAQYTCVAANQQGSIDAKIHVQVVKDPSIVVASNDNSVLSGGAVNFTCQVAASRRGMAMKWVKDRARLSVKGRRVHVWSGWAHGMAVQTLTIFNVTTKDSGQYLCTVENQQGMDTSKPAALTVQEPASAEIQAWVANVVILKGSSVHLKCLFSGTPEPTVSWEMKGRTVQGHAVSNTNGNGSHWTELHINTAQYEDMGQYTCHAGNAYGVAESGVTLLVKGVPKAPSNLQVNQTSSTEVTVSWQLEYNGGEAVNFTIQYRHNSSLTWLELATVSGEFNNITVSRNEGWSRVRFRVIAANIYGGSEPSDEVLFLGKPNDKPHPGDADSRTVNVGALVGGVVAGSLLVVIAILLMVFLKRRKRVPRSESSTGLRAYSTVRRAEGTDDEGNAYDYTYVTRQRPALPPRQEGLYAPVSREARWEVPKRSVSLLKELGSGHFGKVMKGQLKTRQGSKIVAIKMLKKHADEEQRHAFLAELELMKSIAPHPNVVGLVACCSKTTDPYIIVEFCSLGNLLDFLRQSLNDVVYSNLAANSSSLTWRDLLSFAWQVARGMSYLASLKLVHRDLAARNILVDKGYICKIADFGLARNIYVEKQYVKKTKAELPLRWMAYESIYNGITTTESDVWSFGILLWEIVTLGARPYPGMSREEVIEGIHNGYRMPKPAFCSDSLYSVMWECWQLEPSSRPAFPELCKTLSRLRKAETVCINLSDYSVKYANSHLEEELP